MKPPKKLRGAHRRRVLKDALSPWGPCRFQKRSCLTNPWALHQERHAAVEIVCSESSTVLRCSPRLPATRDKNTTRPGHEAESVAVHPASPNPASLLRSIFWERCPSARPLSKSTHACRGLTKQQGLFPKVSRLSGRALSPRVTFLPHVRQELSRQLELKEVCDQVCSEQTPECASRLMQEVSVPVSDCKSPSNKLQDTFAFFILSHRLQVCSSFSFV